jgi:hypothetical protein
MELKNGYKVVYEFAANGERTFYAATSTSYPTRDEEGNITDTKLATFKDEDYLGKTIYEYKGEFYVADTAAAKFDADGKPTGDKIEGFDAILVAKETDSEPVAQDEEDQPAGNDVENPDPEDEDDNTNTEGTESGDETITEPDPDVEE